MRPFKILSILALVASLPANAYANERVKRILGGSPVAQGQHPYITKLRVEGRNCTAIVVRSQWAITAEHCTNGFPLSSIRASVWGVDGNSSPFRTFKAQYHRSLPIVHFSHILSDHSFAREPDDLVYLLFSDALDSSIAAPLSFVPIDDATLSITNNHLELIGVGITERGSTRIPYSVDVHFETYRFSDAAAMWFILSDGEFQGVLGGDSGGAAMTTGPDGQKDLVGVIASLIDVSGAGFHDISLRLSAHKDEAISIIGWSDHEPWRFDAVTDTSQIPLGAWHPNNNLNQEYFCRNLAGRSGILARDISEEESSTPQPATSLPASTSSTNAAVRQNVCTVINEEGMPEVVYDYEALTGSLFGHFTWSLPVESISESYFTAQTSPSDLRTNGSGELMGESVTLVTGNSLPYCLVETEAKTGVVYNTACTLPDGTNHADYKVLIPYEVLENLQQVTTATATRRPTTEPQQPVTEEPIRELPLSNATDVILNQIIKSTDTTTQNSAKPVNSNLFAGAIALFFARLLIR